MNNSTKCFLTLCLAVGTSQLFGACGNGPLYTLEMAAMQLRPTPLAVIDFEYADKYRRLNEELDAAYSESIAISKHGGQLEQEIASVEARLDVVRLGLLNTDDGEQYGLLISEEADLVAQLASLRQDAKKAEKDLDSDELHERENALAKPILDEIRVLQNSQYRALIRKHKQGAICRRFEERGFRSEKHFEGCFKCARSNVPDCKHVCLICRKESEKCNYAQLIERHDMVYKNDYVCPHGKNLKCLMED